MADQKTAQANMPHIGRGGPMGNRMNAEKPKNTWDSLRRILGYIGKNRTIFFSLLVLMTVVTVIDVLGPLFQQKAIDTIQYADGSLQVDFDGMKLYLLILVIMFLLSGILTYFQEVLAAKLAQSTVYSLRNDLFEKISHLPISYTDSHRHGDIMSRMTNDVENISNAVSQSVTSLFSAILTLIGVLVMMLYYSRILTLLALVTIPLTALISNQLAKFMRKYYKQQQVLLGRLNGSVEEKVTGFHTVVAYGKEQDAIDEFTETADQLRSTSIKARVWGSIMGPIMNFLGNFQYVLIAATGGYMVLTYGLLSVGSIQAMLQYSKKFSRPVNMIANQYSTILTALAGAERVFEILDFDDEIDEGTTQIDSKTIEANLDFDHIEFGYVPDHPVLKDLTFSVDAGQKIAIVGATGSGKTTIVNLLTRFYEVNGGSIRLNGIDIREIPKKQLRDSIAIVLQDTVLFHDTIENNIAYGKSDASIEAVQQAAHTAMADTFIERLPEKYDTMLSESGSNLSQGQRQLLAIARAVIADPQILILDEATSSVDTRTEMQIQQAMMNLMKGRTSLIIAHRLSTIRDADSIIVVKDGQIAESGNHEELLEQRGEYYRLYSKQFHGGTI